VLASPGSNLNSSLTTSGVTNLNQFGGSHSAGLEEKIAHLHLQQENESLKKEIRDLNEKLETLKGKSNIRPTLQGEYLDCHTPICLKLPGAEVGGTGRCPM